MVGRIRPKDGVASLACVPAIHVLDAKEDVDARHKATAVRFRLGIAGSSTAADL
jgi:hypothetical protein